MPKSKSLSQCPKCGAREPLVPVKAPYTFASLNSGEESFLMMCYAILKSGSDKGYLCGQEFWYDPLTRRITVKK